MDLVSSKTMEITKLAMDGLMSKYKAVSSNVANVDTPDYQRKDVVFENQLKQIMEKENLKKEIKQKNSITYNPNSLTDIEQKFLVKNNYNAYKPQVIYTDESADPETGNNVVLEKEMMELAKTGTRFSILSQLESNMHKGIQEVITNGGK